MNTDTQVLKESPVSVGQTPPLQPQTPVGTANKEIGHVSEFVKPSGAETIPNIPPEVSEHIKVESDKPDLTPEHKELGLDHAGSNITVSTQPAVPIKLPMSEEEIADKLKTGQDDDSGKWLAGLIRKIIAWGLKVR